MNSLRFFQPKCKTDREGNKRWYLKGELHREDGPAVEHANGDKEWWRKGLPHREDGPAVEEASGTKKWYRNGWLHREDGPASEYPDGTKKWYLNGKRERVETANFNKITLRQASALAVVASSPAPKADVRPARRPRLNR